jgi:hypothetical protein
VNRPHVFALVGAALGAVGDVAGVAAARGWHPRVMIAICLVAWSGCGPAWVALCRVAQGSFTDAAMAWGVASAVLTTCIACGTREGQTRAQWLGFALIIGGAVVQCLGGRRGT